jgi:Holliday junction resolvasome RuvABC endonuclease subunit
MAPATLTTPDTDASPPPGIDLPLRRLPLRQMSNTVLALDLGTTTGWALRLGDRSILSGIQTFRAGRFEGGGMRYLRLTNWLVEIAMRAHGIRRIVFEEVRRHAGTDAAHVYGGFLGTLTSWCEAHEVPYESVPVGTIKRFATGKGNADKAAMTAAMRACGFAPADDNEADAIALLLWADGCAGRPRMTFLDPAAQPPPTPPSCLPLCLWSGS